METRDKTDVRNRIFWICFVAGCFLVYCAWAVIIPYNHAPDEAMRYAIPRFIYQYGELPHGGDPRIRNEIWGISYGFTPITSYIISAFFMKIVSLFTVSETALLIAARFVSVLFSTGTVCFCIGIGQKLFHGIYAKLFVVSVCLLPQFVFISAYVNNDSMGLFTVAWIIYAILVAEENKWNLKSCIFLGVGIGLCLLSYYNCYGIILVALIYALVSVLRDKTIEHKPQFILARIIWVALPALLVAGWWFIRNYVIYDGDLLGMNTSHMYGELYAQEPYKPSNRATPYRSGVSLPGMLVHMGWIHSTCQSFIGQFDYMSVLLQPYCYTMMYLVGGIGFLGNFLLLKRDTLYRIDSKNLFKICMFMMCAITIGISVYYSYFNDFQAQGRYCLPMLLSLNVLIITGWYKLSEKVAPNGKNAVAVVLTAVCILVFLSSFIQTLIPAYL